MKLLILIFIVFNYSNLYGQISVDDLIKMNSKANILSDKQKEALESSGFSNFINQNPGGAISELGLISTTDNCTEGTDCKKAYNKYKELMDSTSSQKNEKAEQE